MKLKKIIILLIIVLIILLSVIAIIISYNIKSIVNIQGTPAIDIPEQTTSSKIEKVSVRNDYYVVQTCVNKFYSYYETIYAGNNDNYILDAEAKASIESEQKKNAEAVYNMLDEEYINYKKITKDNILSKIEKINESVINIKNMYVSQKTNNIYVYIVQGTLREVKTSKISNFQVIVKVDSKNETFSIILQDYIQEKYKDIVLGSNIDIQVADKIEKNNINFYEFSNISDEKYAKDLFSKYQEEILFNTELAYNNLNEEYRNKRFGTLAQFKIYAKDNLKKSVTMQINKYQKSIKDNVTQYICIDQLGNQYIFQETSIMDYKLILDTYTLDLPEFVEKYNSLADNEKVLMNIQKIFEAINSGDYKYVYGKLDATFKLNYFKTQTEFENYMKQKLYTNNKVGYGQYQKNGELYVYSIQITDADGKTAGVITAKVVMQLKENTDFVMSFSIE